MSKEEDVPVAVKKLVDFYQQQTESFVRAKILSLFGEIGSEQGADIQVGYVNIYLLWQLSLKIDCLDVKLLKLFLCKYNVSVNDTKSKQPKYLFIIHKWGWMNDSLFTIQLETSTLFFIVQDSFKG